jgi:hypothetical protein
MPLRCSSESSPGKRPTEDQSASSEDSSSRSSDPSSDGTTRCRSPTVIKRADKFVGPRHPSTRFRRRTLGLQSGRWGGHTEADGAGRPWGRHVNTGKRKVLHYRLPGGHRENHHRGCPAAPCSMSARLRKSACSTTRRSRCRSPADCRPAPAAPSPPPHTRRALLLSHPTEPRLEGPRTRTCARTSG